MPALTALQAGSRPNRERGTNYAMVNVEKMIDTKAIRELCDKATPGPWYWDVIDAHKCICLESARWKVMDFARYGMNGAAPRFLVDGIMERADGLLKSLPGKEHHRGFDNYIDHPDATFIAQSREIIPALLDELEAAQNAHRWIPVTERLPEKDTAVLCFTALGQKTGWVGASGGFNFTYGKGVVTHWMPLPEPPKGDNHE